MTTLEDRFTSTIDHLDLPEPELVDQVLGDIAVGRLATGSIAGVGQLRHRVLVAAAAAVVVAFALVFAITPVREAVADWFGIGATQFELDPAATLDGVSESTAAAIGGQRVNAAENPLPQFEEPVAVFDQAAVAGRTYAWSVANDRAPLGETEIGVLLTVRAINGLQETKRVTSGVGIEQVTFPFGGATVDGLWIDGDHLFVGPGTDRALLAERVLIWTSDGLQFRLEADRDRAGMIALAESVEGGTGLLPAG